MTRSQINSYRKSLEKLAEQVERNLGQDQRELMRDEEPNVAGGPMASTENEVNSAAVEVGVGLIANESLLLAEVKNALGRIAAGTFGECESCHKPISAARLEALPYVRHCIRCARVAQSVRR